MREMEAAGAPLAAILLAVEAIEARDEQKARQRRAAADRKARQRERERDSHATVTRQSQDSHCDKVPEVPPNDIYSNPPPTLQPSPKASPSPRGRASSGSRGTRLPDDWKQERFGEGTEARKIIDRRGQDWGKATLEKFRNYWGAMAGRQGVKTDWQKTWANWVVEEDRRDGTGRNGAGADRRRSEGDGFTRALRRASAQLEANDTGRGQGDFGMG